MSDSDTVQDASADADPYAEPCEGRPAPGKPLGFDPNGADLRWIDHVKHEFRVQAREEGASILVGACPRCCHQIDAPIEKHYLRPQATVEVTLACNCHQHESTDPNLPGCGRFANFTVDVD